MTWMMMVLLNEKQDKSRPRTDWYPRTVYVLSFTGHLFIRTFQFVVILKHSELLERNVSLVLQA